MKTYIISWITFIQQFFSLFEEGSSKNNNTGCAITNFIVLTFREFDKESGNGMLNFHFFNDGGSIIGDGDFLIWGDDQFIESFGS